ncbi:Cysteine-rich CWC [Ectothiorhodosinus mongolicus]|uniref:Cysteine-rich CWC n=1 Tax=Ectothiorhodosinus mongolicus TaxID=233100 RepID=A0A1R3W263_9GAMM|nr:cysteine-rich CWC family protein [Ectothiorhodosinus mongolicus]ULX57110.1 hypothetical protein CKX93_05035 [Ectothiorhodosinus mongolicus]SIT69978.1 Cysteine-rich CWC [Ectothiorhodosinus mongolicus]
MAWEEPVLDGPKACPRCGSPFHCKVTDIKHCDCVAVRVELPVLKTLKQEFPDCLCTACLRELAEGHISG